ncbi:DUF6959 family protein [Stenotrophomonas maltophilia]|uniref:DUF6959 family protein n=1 Tax=Stenotrophomonas maltophilia TaxID=40324 RepID=UPI001CED6FB9
MNAQFLPLSMKTETTLSVYGQLGNHAVVRIPGRRLPGLILQADTVAGFLAQLQADTVAGFLAQLQEAQACLRSGRAQRTDAELDMLIDVLQQWYALIESRLADAGEAL